MRRVAGCFIMLLLSVGLESGPHHGQYLVRFDPQSLEGPEAQLLSRGLWRHRLAQIDNDRVDLLNIANALLHDRSNLILRNGFVPG
jgi:hypothetical protein